MSVCPHCLRPINWCECVPSGFSSNTVGKVVFGPAQKTKGWLAAEAKRSTMNLAEREAACILRAIKELGEVEFYARINGHDLRTVLEERLGQLKADYQRIDAAARGGLGGDGERT